MLLIFLVVYVLLLFLSSFFVLFTMLPVSLDCPSLIVHLVFSNVYFPILIIYHSRLWLGDWRGYMYAILLFGFTLFRTIIDLQDGHLLGRIERRLWTSITSIVYKKVKKQHENKNEGINDCICLFFSQIYINWNITNDKKKSLTGLQTLHTVEHKDLL
jgi:hypothetical protein